jgi:hypothetical protein
MLRRAPTAILLSTRDVKEHLDHLEQQKSHRQENAQPKKHKPAFFSSFRGRESLACRSISPENQRGNHDFTYGSGCVGPDGVMGFGILPEGRSAFSPSGLSLGNLTLDDEAGDTGLIQLSPSEREGSPEKDYEIVHAPIYEDHNGYPPRRQSDSSESSEEPPQLREGEYAKQQEMDVFDYGGFIETSLDESSSLLGE